MAILFNNKTKTPEKKKEKKTNRNANYKNIIIVFVDKILNLSTHLIHIAS